jgi:hypothetical protein
LLPPGFVKRITDSSLDHLADAPVHMQVPDIESLIELVRLLPPGQSTDAIRKLKNVLAEVVVQDPKQWNSYNVKPLTFVHSPQSPFYPEMEKAIGANLDYTISTQKSDGGWGLTWSWEDRNPQPGNWRKKSGEAWCRWKTCKHCKLFTASGSKRGIEAMAFSRAHENQ